MYTTSGSAAMGFESDVENAWLPSRGEEQRSALPERPRHGEEHPSDDARQGDGKHDAASDAPSRPPSAIPPSTSARGTVRTAASVARATTGSIRIDRATLAEIAAK